MVDRFVLSLNGKAFLAVLLLLLPMVNIATDAYTAPVVLLFLYAMFSKEGREFIVGAAKSFWLFGAFFLFALLSAIWSKFPLLVMKNFQDIIFFPLVSFFAIGSLFFGRGGKLVGVVVQGLFFILFAISLVLFLSGGRESIWRAFYDLGYYSTYVVILAAASVPFLFGVRRFVFYIALIFMFFMTDQRLVWVVLPFIFSADAIANGFYRKAGFWLVLIVLSVLSYFVLKYLQTVRPADAFRQISGQSEMGLVQYFMSNERIRIWVKWLELSRDNFFGGLGFSRDGVFNAFNRGGVEGVEGLRHGHNLLINTLMQLGVVGVALLLLGYAQFIRFMLRFLRHPVASSAILVLGFYFLRNMVDHFESRRVMMVYFGLLGMCYGGVMSQRLSTDLSAEGKGK